MNSTPDISESLNSDEVTSSNEGPLESSSGLANQDDQINDARNPNNDSNDDDNNDNTDAEETASQSSQRSQLSLLERIRLQRKNESVAAQQKKNQSNISDTTPTQIQIPQYDSTNTTDDSHAEASHGRSFFSHAWGNIQSSMQSGMRHYEPLQQQHGSEEDGMNEALLAPTASTTIQASEEDYSMSGYFMTFVKDIHEGFKKLPISLRVVVILFLLYVSWRLI